MFDLTCVIPLYGDTCEQVSLRMIASLAVQQTRYNVHYMFMYDNTVPLSVMKNIGCLLSGKQQFDFVNCADKTCSGYKRNTGLKIAVETSNYVWFLDQDDYLVRDDTFEIILDSCYQHNFNAIQIRFTVPDTLDNYNKNVILKTPTMPWKYIYKTSNIADYRFEEDCEYGSDIPMTIRYLAENNHMKFNEDLTLNIYNPIPMLKPVMYFYNYLNANSHMYTFAEKTTDEQKAPIEHAYEIMGRIKSNCESN